MFLERRILKIYDKFTGEHPCRSVILIKLLYNFIEITLRHEYSPVNFLHIFRTPFLKNTSGRLLLLFVNHLDKIFCLLEINIHINASKNRCPHHSASYISLKDSVR